MKINDNASPGMGRQYGSPETRVIPVKSQSVLCVSPLGEKFATETEEGDENW